jgi:amidophosphoribosyltransferase
MTEEIHHECGLGLIRLRKPLSWYQEKYGNSRWGLQKMYLLMEKMHNRGQDGAGLAVVKMNSLPGSPFVNRLRNNQTDPWMSLYKEVQKSWNQTLQEFPTLTEDASIAMNHYPWLGEVMMGHLRYGTHGGNSIDYCHPFIRHSNWRSRTLVMAGNFNLTNVEELFQRLVQMGQHPPYQADTVTVMERIGHFLEEENERLRKIIQPEGTLTLESSLKISSLLDLPKILERAVNRWDGGYVMGGVLGTGDSFVLRDPNGIRPGWWYQTEEVVVVASERAAIATTFNCEMDAIQELTPASILWIKADGEIQETRIMEAGPKTSCSFERIYFSRGNDPDIYAERKALGKKIVPAVLEALHQDLDNTVFSYIPNTAEASFFGMVKGLETTLAEKRLKQWETDGLPVTREAYLEMWQTRVRVEKSVIKDAKLRTFITDDQQRDELVTHIYDITYGILKPGKDTLVCLDDSIVRGTTLRNSILRMLARLKPAGIVIVSAAPQIRYPDCYGIDMSQIGRFVAFQAAVELTRERNQFETLESLYQEIVEAEKQGESHLENHVKKLYAPFTEKELSDKIAQMLKPLDYEGSLQVVYLPLEELSKAIPHHTGDWYFSGNYPTPGGNRVVNRAFLQFMQGDSGRAY